MKKTIILVLVAVLLLGVLFFIKKKEPTVTIDPAREQKCKEFLAVALFPNDGSSQTFFEQCRRGEPVLPGESDSQ